MFAPIALVVVTILLATAFQLYVLVRERQLLRARFEAQQTPLEEVQKVRDQLQSIAKSTYQLSAAGNKNATLVIERLKRAGILVSKDGVGGDN